MRPGTRCSLCPSSDGHTIICVLGAHSVLCCHPCLPISCPSLYLLLTSEHCQGHVPMPYGLILCHPASNAPATSELVPVCALALQQESPPSSHTHQRGDKAQSRAVWGQGLSRHGLMLGKQNPPWTGTLLSATAGLDIVLWTLVQATAKYG